jgi:hypothetical protein
MDNIFKAIFAAGVISVITGNPVIAMSIGWFVYFYLKQKDNKSDTIV